MIENKRKNIILILLLIIGIIIISFLSIILGSKNIDIKVIKESFFNFNPDDVDHQIIMYSRVPRIIGSLMIGAFLAISGSMMQGMTRNIIASPSILGILDGSTFFVTLCIILFPASSNILLIVFSLMGSAFGAFIVFFMSSIIPNGMNPVRLTIIGAITGTFLSSLSVGLSIYFRTSQDISFWYYSRINQLTPNMIKWIIPFAILGIIMALILSESITVLSLGEEIAIGLGQNIKKNKILISLTVIILSGISVAMAGKISFIGLMIPHITKYFVGHDYKKIIPISGLIGAFFLSGADVLSRFLNYPFETPVGVVTALFGVPFFLYLAGKKGEKNYA